MPLAVRPAATPTNCCSFLQFRLLRAVQCLPPGALQTRQHAYALPGAYLDLAPV